MTDLLPLLPISGALASSICIYLWSGDAKRRARALRIIKLFIGR